MRVITSLRAKRSNLVEIAQQDCFVARSAPRNDNMLLSLSLCLTGELVFDADTDSQQAAVVAVAADNHQTDRCSARRLDRQTQRAAIEEIDDCGVAQQLLV